MGRHERKALFVPGKTVVYRRRLDEAGYGWAAGFFVRASTTGNPKTSAKHWTTSEEIICPETQNVLWKQHWFPHEQ